MPKSSLIDAHCHLDFINFDTDRAEVLERAKQNSISDIIIPGISVNNWEKITSLCEQNKKLHPCYGLHPYWVNQHNDRDLTKLEQLIKQIPCIAIGECGLDYRPKQADKKKQQYFFEAQLDIAEKNELPVVIHSVRATEDVIQQLRNHTGLTGMIHSYSGSYEQALKLIEMGFYISFGGAITYDRANKLRDTASKLPLTSILIETDAPDQPDSAHQNERNEPAYLVEVFNTLCKLRQETKTDIAKQTTENTKKLFNLS
ncbi:MAG: TatD family hydrolase [Gammaproteobacteria bacterium]|nr:TatD family hydrolase [Gammaproteobacteria bacterium]